MKRRSFFGTLAGLLLAPLAIKDKPVGKIVGVNVATGRSRGTRIFVSTPMGRSPSYRFILDEYA